RRLVHRIMCHIGSGKNDAAAVWPNESDNHVEACRLAGAIRSEQSHNFSGARIDIDSIDYRPTAVNFHELLGLQNAVDLRPGWWRNLRCRTRCSLADHGVAVAFAEASGLLSFFFSPSSVFGS